MRRASSSRGRSRPRSCKPGPEPGPALVHGGGEPATLRAMTTLRILLGASVLLAVTACQSKEKKCEHARDVLLATMDEYAKEALLTVPPAERAAFETQVKAEVEHARSVFVGECTKLDDAAMECIARIDEVVAAEARVQDALDAAYGKCPKDAIGLVEQTCIEHERNAAMEKEKAAWKGPDCVASLEALTQRIHADAPAPSSPDDGSAP
jgi:hypothetical protein